MEDPIVIEKTIFTENQMKTIIDIWYGDDDIFCLIAKGRVKSHLANGKDLDGDFLIELIELENEGWYRKPGA